MLRAGIIEQVGAQLDLYDEHWDNAEFADKVARLPLAEQPGTLWDYGHSTDVLGSVIEVVQGSASAAHAPAIRLHAEQVDTALAWLRQRQVRVIGAHPASSLGYVHVDVITPWGQTLELVGPGTLPANDPRSQLAAD